MIAFAAVLQLSAVNQETSRQENGKNSDEKANISSAPRVTVIAPPIISRQPSTIQGDGITTKNDIPKLDWFGLTPDSLTARSTVILTFFTFLLGFFTYFLWRSTQKAVRGGTDALDLARKEFISTHRPRLRVRWISNEGRDYGNIWRARMIIVNVGDTNATIEGIGADIGRRDPYTMKWIDPGLDIDIIKKRMGFGLIFESGQSEFISFESQAKISSSDMTDLANGRYELCAVGFIIYHDDNNTLRRTGFIWKWNIKTETFDPIESHEYAYED